jgi:hypothetical protein
MINMPHRPNIQMRLRPLKLPLPHTDLISLSLPRRAVADPAASPSPGAAVKYRRRASIT